MLNEILNSIVEKGSYQTCIDYLINTGMSEFTAIILVSCLLNNDFK